MDMVAEFLKKKYANNKEVFAPILALHKIYDSLGIKDNKFDKDFIDGEPVRLGV